MNKTLITTMAAGTVFGAGVVVTQNNHAHADSKSDVKNAQNKVNAAKAKVDEASKGKEVAEVKYDIPSDLQKQLTDAQNKVNNLQNNVNLAQQNLQRYSDKKQQIQQQIDDLNSVNDANNNPEYAKAKNAYNSYKSQYDTELANFNAQNTLNLPIVPLSSDARTQWENIVNNTNADTIENLIIQEKQVVDWMSKQPQLNWVDNDPNDANTFVDFNNITDEQQTIIQNFAGSIVNSYRQQVGLPLVYTNDKNMVKIANDIMRKNTVLFDHDRNLTHEISVNTTYYLQTIKAPGQFLNAAFSGGYEGENLSQGMAKQTNQGITLPGNFYNGYNTMNHVSMKEIKEAIYSDIMMLTIRDYSSFGKHSMLNMRLNSSQNYKDTADTMVVVFDQYGQGHYEFISMFSDNYNAQMVFPTAVQSTLSGVSQQLLKSGSDLGTLMKGMSESETKMNATYKDPGTKLDSAKYDMQYNDAQLANISGWLKTYNSNLQGAKDQLKDIQDKINNYPGKSVTVNKVDQSALDSAKQAYKDAVKELNEAKARAGKTTWDVPAVGKHSEYTKTAEDKHEATKHETKKRVVKKATKRAKKHVVKRIVKKAKQLFSIRIKANKVYAYKTIALHKSGRKIEKKGTKLYVYKIVKKGHKEYYRIYGNRVITANKHYVVKIK